jgi:hypothetical protein
VFRNVIGALCGLTVEEHPDSKHVMELFSWKGASLESDVLFSRFVHEHLQRRAIAGSVERERLFRCGHCDEAVRDAKAVRARLSAGKLDIVCQYCDASVPIADELERRFGDGAVAGKVRDLEREERKRRRSEVGVTAARAKNDAEEYDVFLAYNSKDRALVEMIARGLRDRGINPWFDGWCLPPGRQFQREIERVFYSVASAVVFVGRDGVGPWEDLEVKVAIQMFVKRNAPVIPVLLPGAGSVDDLPLFLREFSFVSFGAFPEEDGALDQLVWGITGVRS